MAIVCASSVLFLLAFITFLAGGPKSFGVSDNNDWFLILLTIGSSAAMVILWLCIRAIVLVKASTEDGLEYSIHRSRITRIVLIYFLSEKSGISLLGSSEETGIPDSGPINRCPRSTFCQFSLDGFSAVNRKAKKIEDRPGERETSEIVPPNLGWHI